MLVNITTMAELDIEGIVRKKYFITYICCTIVIAAGLIIFLYGIQSLPQSIPIDNRDLLQYQSTKSSEQQAADLRKYQMETSQFKLAISGVGVLIFGVCLAVYYSNRATQEVDSLYEAQNYRNRRDAEEKLRRDILKQQEQQKEQQKQKQQQENKTNNVTFSTLPVVPPPVKLPKPETVAGKFSYYPANYRNGMLRIYPNNLEATPSS